MLELQRFAMSATGRQPSFQCALMSGAVAGPSVDIALYPLDTIKTRLQAPGGFIKAGGFRGVYNGLGIAALGSAPGSMFFFSTYEGTKGVIGTTCAAQAPLLLCLPAPGLTAAAAAQVRQGRAGVAGLAHGRRLRWRNCGVLGARPDRECEAEAAGGGLPTDDGVRARDPCRGRRLGLLRRLCVYPPSHAPHSLPASSQLGNECANPG